MTLNNRRLRQPVTLCSSGANGLDAVRFARAYLYGLAVGGEAGAKRGSCSYARRCAPGIRR